MATVEVPAVISEYAIIVDPSDNVAVVKKATFAVSLLGNLYFPTTKALRHKDV